MQGRVNEWSPFFQFVHDHCCHPNLDFLTSVEFTLCYKELLKIFLARVKCCHFHSHPQDPTTEVLKTIVLLYSSTVPGIWSVQKGLCLILCGSAEFKIRKNSRSLGVDGYTWPLRSLPELVNQSQFSIFNVIFMVRTSKLATVSYFHFRNFLHVVQWQHSPPTPPPPVIIGEWRILPPLTSSSMVKSAKYSCLWIFSVARSSLTPSKW